jgi:hypothetical protein
MYRTGAAPLPALASTEFSTSNLNTSAACLSRESSQGDTSDEPKCENDKVPDIISIESGDDQLALGVDEQNTAQHVCARRN